MILAEIQRREAQEQLDEEIARTGASLGGFIKAAWHVLEPGTEYVHGWHIDCIADHLKAVSAGHLTRVLFNVPPGTMKSLLTSVFWPAFEWGPLGMPHLRYYSTSYAEKWVKRDTRRMRDLIQSDWYQQRWPLKLLREAEMSFENERRGTREGTAFVSMTGGRGDRLIIDDPHSTEQAESDADRARAVRIFRESAPSRLIDARTSAIVIDMQRLHRDDISGLILEKEFGYTHVMLPMEFEPERKCYTSIGFEDPRTKEGELLFPARFPRDVVERDKAIMGPYAVAGQYQQRPVPRGGGMFKDHWFKRCPAAPAGLQEVRGWDLAATEGPEGEGAATAGVKIGRSPDGLFYITGCVAERTSAHQQQTLILNTAAKDGYGVRISLPQDPGQAGKVQAQALVSMLAGFIVSSSPETGDKADRALPLAAQCEAGNVYIVEGPWNDAFIDEITMFPMGKIKDRVDAASRAFAELVMRFEPNPANITLMGITRRSPNTGLGF